MQIEVEVVLAMPARQYTKTLLVTPGTSARDVVSQVLTQGWLTGAATDVDPMQAPLGIFGELIEDSHEVRAGDRIEIYRPLQQDPKELRRQRAARRKG